MPGMDSVERYLAQWESIKPLVRDWPVDDDEPSWYQMVDDRLNDLEERRLSDLLESPASPWFIANTVGLWVLIALVVAVVAGSVLT